MNELITFIKEFDLHNLVCIGVMFFFITRSWRNEVKEETKSIREEIVSIRSEIAQQGLRTDKLYQMFIDLLKEKKS